MTARDAPAPGSVHPALPLLAALVSNLLLGAAVTATRYVLPQTDYVTLAFLRYALGALSLLPLVLLLRPALPGRRDAALLGLLGLVLFAAFPLTYNAALQYTLATRAAVMFALVPLQTLGLSALLGYDAFSLRKLAGTLLALAGVALALGDPASLLAAPPGAWRGDLLMLATVSLGSVYNVLSRKPLLRQPALTATTVSMLAGAGCLGLVLAARQAALPAAGASLAFTGWGWAAVGFVAIGGASLGYGLFVWALKAATPARVAVFVPVSPLSAAVLAALLLGEPATPALAVGLACVTVGIVLVNRPGQRARGA